MKKLSLTVLIAILFFTSNAQINDLAISPTNLSICQGNDVNIFTSSSENGISYYLRDNNNTIIDGPLVGTGDDLMFNTGPITNNNTYNVFAKIDSIALDFDGINDKVELSYSQPTTSTFTIELWIYPQATAYTRIVSSYDGTGTFGANELIFDTYDAASPNGTGLRFGVSSASGVEHIYSVPNVLTLNTWNHVAASFDNGIIRLYVDGFPVGTSPMGSFTSLSSTTKFLTLGEDRILTSAQYFQGKMDELRIWNTARTTAELTANKDNLVAWNVNLKAYYRLNDVNSLVAVDEIAGKNGTLINMNQTTDWVPGIIYTDFEMTQTVSINVDPVSNQTVSSASNMVCLGDSTTIALANSQVGVSYSLRNNNNDIVDGPIAGTGAQLMFNTGPVNNTTTFNVYGNKLDNDAYFHALDFDGNDRVDLTYTQPSTNTLTVELWVYPRVTTYTRIVSSYDGSGPMGANELLLDTYHNSSTNGRGLRFAVSSSAAVEHIFSVPNVLTLNAWNHIAASFDNGTTKLYVDGILVGTSSPAPFNSLSSTTNTVSLGADRIFVSSSTYYQGMMDELRIWNTARTANELLTNKNGCLTGSEIGLEAYFPMNKGMYSTITDLANGNSGTFSLGMDSVTSWIPSSHIICEDCGLQMSPTATILVTDVDSTVTVTGNVLMSNQAGASYQWVDCNNSNAPIAGATNQSFAPTANGNYAVEVTLNGCTHRSVCENVSGLGLSSLQSIEASIYPNPTENVLHIVTAEIIDKVTIYNTNGALIKDLSGSVQKVDVSELPQGMYIIIVQSDKGVLQHSFVKK